jgi:hypothetical protein
MSCGRSTSRKCNNGNSDSIGREHFEKHLNILVDTAIIYYITELKLSENSEFPESAVANTRTQQIYSIFRRGWAVRVK